MRLLWRKAIHVDVFLVNEGNLLNSISSAFLSLSVEMPVGFERYTTLWEVYFESDPGLCFHENKTQNTPDSQHWTPQEQILQVHETLLSLK